MKHEALRTIASQVRHSRAMLGLALKRIALKYDAARKRAVRADAAARAAIEAVATIPQEYTAERAEAAGRARLAIEQVREARAAMQAYIAERRRLKAEGREATKAWARDVTTARREARAAHHHTLGDRSPAVLAVVPAPAMSAPAPVPSLPSSTPSGEPFDDPEYR